MKQAGPSVAFQNKIENMWGFLEGSDVFVATGVFGETDGRKNKFCRFLLFCEVGTLHWLTKIKVTS